jgi:hypothetical protein
MKPKVNAKSRTKAAGKAQHKNAAGSARSRAGNKKAAGAA